MSKLKRLDALMPAQAAASDPAHHASVSASAGTGKTHVLTARVLRLLLSGVDPASILCLTFTKSGAAEMAERLNARLAAWVRLPDHHLHHDLFQLGEDKRPGVHDTARSLFARVLDARGGGLRILTIHAFAQSLLAAFPDEARMLPGFRPLDGREESRLARATLAAMLVDAERGGDLGLLADVEAVSHRLGEQEAERLLMAAARAPEAMAAFGSREAIAPILRRLFGVPDREVEAVLAERCHDDHFDLQTLERVAAANAAWATQKGLKYADTIAGWRALSCEERAAALQTIREVVHTKKGELRAHAGPLKADPGYAEHAARLGDACAELIALRARAALVETFASALRAGQAFSLAYGAAKRAAGYVDFDDLIRGAEGLLRTRGIGEWVRYKLDQDTDHILVDEAQDTNAAQWNIVRALAGEYFAGEGATARRRTLFTVGDFKQAIFSFQGTDPREFGRARDEFEARARAADQEFRDLSLDTSFRSSPPVLALVDRVLADVGRDSLGLPEDAPPHDSVHIRRGGSVTLWPPVIAEAATGGDEDEEPGEEGWVADATRLLAGKIAHTVAAWRENPPYLESRKRPMRPEDVLILVRSRGALASLLVARLLQAGVPVAGVDRLRLDAPLAVKDLLAAARFAVQPSDDLNLASLLVSPLLAWSQEELLALAAGRRGSLWDALRDSASVPPASRETLVAIQGMADFATPHAFFETILSTLGGRRALLGRLGPEAIDPIEELLSSALEFEEVSSTSLDTFLDWFARGEIEIKRDPSAPLDAVRVMTVHGAKGLQAPVVILADATADPDKRRGGFVQVPVPDAAASFPLFRPRKAELFEPLKTIAEDADRREREEHGRLLYVAMTRAEEHLLIGGALGPGARGVVSEGSWYRPIAEAMAALGAEPVADPLWPGALRYGVAGAATAGAKARALTAVASIPPPAWLRQPAPAEARPPRPLAPSAIGRDDAPDPPPGPEMRRAARRGSLLHALFERLPGVPPADRRLAGDAWLRGSGGVADVDERAALLADALRVIEDPALADLFGPDALAEAPLTAVLPDGTVVAGSVDRLLVTPDRVRVVDFKTGRAVPESLDDVPAAYVRQMRAYADALGVIFPGRAIEASLLFTAGPRAFDLPLERAAASTT